MQIVPSMRFRVMASAIAASIVVLISSGSARAQLYSATLVTGLPSNCEIYGINNAHTIVGDYIASDSLIHAFAFNAGVITDLGTIPGGGFENTAYAINNAGTIVGAAYGADNVLHAISYSNGTMTDLGGLGGHVGSIAYAVSSSGIIAGWASTASDTGGHAFIYSNGAMTDLGTLGDPTQTSYGTGVNDAGTVVGWSQTTTSSARHAFSYSGGLMTGLGNLGGSTDLTDNSEAVGINNAGTIGGDAAGQGSSNSIFSYSNGVMTNQGAVGESDVTAVAMNSSGTIIGFGVVPPGHSIGFVTVNGVATDLNTLVNLPGITLSDPVCINDLGDIVVFGPIGAPYLLSLIPGGEATTPTPTPTPSPAPSPTPTPTPTPTPSPVPSATGTTADGFAYADSGGAVVIVGYTGSGGAVTVPAQIGGDPVTNIGTSAFIANSSITSVTIPGSVIEIGDHAFSDCLNLTSVTISSGVTTIGVEAFSDCETLTGVTIPGSVTNIKDEAFADCFDLTNLTISNGVTTIGFQAFFYCYSLTSVTIPASVTSIGSEAFLVCLSLSQITFLGNAPAPDQTVFANVASNASITYAIGATGWTNPFDGLPASPSAMTPTPTPTPTPMPTPTPAPTPSPIPTSNAARLINISTRAQVGTGGNILIPGFVVSGSGSETVLIRCDGPSLTQFNVPGVLSQPSLSVFDSSQHLIASNTGWGTNSNPALIASSAAQVGAFAFSSNSADCALLVSLPAGQYTVQVSGVNNSTGVALAEVYEVATTGTRLINISTRAQVGTGGNILIPGFVIAGAGTEQLLVRADGPSLAQFSVPGVLSTPNLSVFDNTATMIASNTGWGTSSNPSQIATVGRTVGAFALTQGSADSAQIVNLSAGSYTIQVSGVNNSTGVALAEVYEVPQL